MGVKVTVESVHGGAGKQRMAFFRCEYEDGTAKTYGPVITTDPAFVPADYCAILQAKLEGEQDDGLLRR
jgi:hypothetical protein